MMHAYGRMYQLLPILTIGILCSTMILPAYASSNFVTECIINGNPINVTVNYGSPVIISDETPDYDATESTITIKGETYDTILIANSETEGDGIADEDGNVDVQFTMYDSRPFCFAIHHFNGENSKLRITVTIDGVTKQYTSNISGNVIHYIGQDNKYFTLANLVNNEDWISSANTIEISIVNYNGHVPDNVTFNIVFLE